MSLAEILLNGTSPDPNVRQPAEQQLQQAENQNFPAYIIGLCQELGNDNTHINARQLAGLLLKNTVVAKDENQKRILFERWVQLADNVKEQVKGMVLSILGSSQKNARSTASLVVAKIAAVEIPRNTWGNLIEILVGNIKSQNQDLRQASFEALGYVCEECPQHLQDHSNSILNAISSGLAVEQKNDAIKLAATVALLNSLEFVKNNFANPNERTLIMQMVFAAAQSPDTKVRVAAYQCLVAIATLYYSYLGEYIEYIFNMTSAAIRQEDEEVAQQAIEFWCTICDEEIEINDEIEEAQSRGQQPHRESGNFMNKALKDIMPLILVSLTKQSEELDDDTWNVAKSAALCVGLVSENTTNHIVEHVLPFVQQHFQNSDWRFKEASVLAFGYMLDGPDRKALIPYVQQAFPVLLQHMQDQHDLVKDTTAWTLGRVCDLFAFDVVNEQTLRTLMETLLQGLKSDSPSIARKVCWAIHNLASAVTLNDNQKTSVMSPYFAVLVQTLLTLSERLDEPKLMSSAFTTINALVSSAAPDMDHLVSELLPVLSARLRGSFATMQNCTPQQMAVLSDVQAHLCGALQAIIEKMPGNVLVRFSDDLMRLFIDVLQVPNTTIHEEAIHAIGDLAKGLGNNFSKYMQAVQPILLHGLSNAQEHHVCSNSVGALSAVAEAIGAQLVPICDDFMSVLLQNLQNPQIDRSVKPQIISCLADIAFAVGGDFARYLEYVMVMLVQASGFSFEVLDFENLEYLNLLRESILEAYTAILQSLGEDKKAQLFIPYLEKLHPFLDVISKDPNREDKVLKGAIGLIGDLAAQLGPASGPLLQTPCCSNLVQAGLQTQSAKIQQLSQWSQSTIQKVLNNGGR